MFNALTLPIGCGRFEHYQRALEEGSVHKQPGLPLWHIIGYDACCQVFRDTRHFSNDPMNSFLAVSEVLTADERLQRLSLVLGQTAEYAEHLMLMSDPPKHTRLRNLVVRAFAPAAMRRLTDQVQQVANELIDEILKKDSFDFVEEFAIPLPVHIVAEILGVDPENRHNFKRWSDGFVSVPAQSVLAGINQVQTGNWRQEFSDYFMEIISRRRKEPRNDLISDLIRHEEAGEKLSTNELLAMCVLLMVAGNETTTNMLTGTLLALTQHPDEYDYLLAHRARIPEAIEEGLRYYAPIQGIPRYAAGDATLAGQTIKKGSMVMVWAGAANRDEDAFPVPERFDVTRSPNRHLSFGLGIHHCMGAGLARIEGQIAFETLFRRLGKITPLPETGPEFVQSSFLFGLKRFDMRYEGASAEKASSY